MQAVVDRRGLKASVKATTDRRVAVENADYVVTTFQQGGLDAYKLDIEIPQKYGVEQCVGDTLGPGGVFRALRTIPVLLDLCDEMDELAPDALLLNYVNPMAANCWAVAEGSGRPHIGLCHSVQGTSEMLAKWIDVPYDEVNFLCAGINHQAFFLEFRRGKEDLYPMLWEAIERPGGHGRGTGAHRYHEVLRLFRHRVERPRQRVHAVLPQERRHGQRATRPALYRSLLTTGSTLDAPAATCATACTAWNNSKATMTRSWAASSPPSAATNMVRGSSRRWRPTSRSRWQATSPTHGLITNLPDGCCVEVPCLVDASGVQPTFIGNLPSQLAALNRTNINVQNLIVDAALTGDVDAVYHAVMLDPLTAAVCTLPQIHSMVSELLEAETQWLPQF